VPRHTAKSPLCRAFFQGAWQGAHLCRVFFTWRTAKGVARRYIPAPSVAFVCRAPWKNARQRLFTVRCQTRRTTKGLYRAKCYHVPFVVCPDEKRTTKSLPCVLGPLPWAHIGWWCGVRSEETRVESRRGDSVSDFRTTRVRTDGFRVRRGNSDLSQRRGRQIALFPLCMLHCVAEKASNIRKPNTIISLLHSFSSPPELRRRPRPLSPCRACGIIIYVSNYLIK
jgi:hypothetical protein